MIKRNSTTKLKVADEIRSRILLKSATSNKSLRSSSANSYKNNTYNNYNTYKSSKSGGIYIDEDTTQQPLATEGSERNGPYIVLDTGEGNMEDVGDGDNYEEAFNEYNENQKHNTAQTYKTYNTQGSSDESYKHFEKRQSIREKEKRQLTAYEIECKEVKEKRKIKAPDFKKTITREQLDTILDSTKAVIPFTLPNYDSIKPSKYKSINFQLNHIPKFI